MILTFRDGLRMKIAEAGKGTRGFELRMSFAETCLRCTI